MRSIKYLVSLLIILTTQSCQKGDHIYPENPEYVQTNIDPANDEHLMNLLASTVLGETNAGGRHMSSPIGNINLDEALKVEHLANSVTRYTFKIESSEDLTFSNLIIKETDAGDVSGYIMRYIPDFDWLVANNGKIILTDFTGYVALSLLNGLDFYYVRVDKGKGYAYALPLEEDENGRLLGDCIGSGGTSGSGSGGSGPAGGSYYWSSDMAMDFTGGTAYGIVEEETQPLQARFKIFGYNTFRARMLCDESNLPESDACTDDTSPDAAEEECDASPIGVLGEDIDLIKSVLKFRLETDPLALLDIDCDQIENWQELVQHIPEDAVIDKVINLINTDNSVIGGWDIQFIENAGGAVVNMDYFPVHVSTLPNNPTTGQKFSPDQFLNYIRRNINDLLGPSTFEPYCEISNLCQQETDLWNSYNPLGAIIKIDIPAFDGTGGDLLGNDGVVICSEFTNDHWNFMTLEAPVDSNHPVSGTRSFGYEPNADGTYNFFIRGVDRFESGMLEAAADAISGFENSFFGADELWESFQGGLNNFVDNNGGTSSIIPPVKNRPDWQRVRDVLEGQRPISDLGCN